MELEGVERCSAGDLLSSVGVAVDRQQLLAVAPGLDQIRSVFEEVST